jgi:putative protein kinase ArgK-like GTPase of G3E family
MRRFLMILAFAAVAAIAAPAGASAKDADVVAAYKSHRPALERAVDAYKHAVRKARRTQKRRWYRRLIAVDKRMNRVLTRLVTAVEKRHPSTKTGSRGKRCTLAAHRYWRKANRLEIAAVRAFLNGNRRRADRLIARGTRIMRRKALPNDRCRKRAFRKIAARS